MKKLYKFQIVATHKYFIEVEANDREQATELAEKKWADKDYDAHSYIDEDWSLKSAEDIGNDDEEPADEDLIKVDYTEEKNKFEE